MSLQKFGESCLSEGDLRNAREYFLRKFTIVKRDDVSSKMRVELISPSRLKLILLFRIYEIIKKVKLEVSIGKYKLREITLEDEANINYNDS